jgi:hypothetical protein
LNNRVSSSKTEVCSDAFSSAIFNLLFFTTFSLSSLDMDAGEMCQFAALMPRHIASNRETGSHS